MIVLGAVAVVLLIPALWVYVSLTATPIFPNAANVPTVMPSAPPPKWAGAVAQARQTVRASVAEQNLPGLSVAVGIDGGIVWAEGFGFADLKSSVPVTPNHRFRVGTASTAVTSAAAGLLIENGRLKLDDEIQRYLPAFPKKPWPVTLRELMAHTAGVDVGDGAPLFTKHCEQPAEAL
jgi:CubicO group peptidase (beta-lactamase class C family)